MSKQGPPSPGQEETSSLEALLLTVYTAAFVVFLLVWVVFELLGWVGDRWRDKRHAGVLYDQPPAQLGLYSGARARWLAAHARRPRQETREKSQNDESVFQYLECGFTGFTPMLGQGDDEEPVAYRLARRDGPTVLKKYEAQAWSGYGLSDPEAYRKYREQVQLGRILVRAQHCLYCGSPLRKEFTREFRFTERTLRWRYIAATCLHCGWWCVTHLYAEESWYFWSERWVHAYAIMRRFDPLAIETPLSLARDYLARNPHKLARFDPFRFEDLMADCLGDVFGDCEIVKLGGRKDRGIDIKAVRADGKTTLVQVKRRADFSKTEGVATVRELHGVMLREGIPRGMVISTAHDFSAAARDEVVMTGRRLRHYSMDLLPLAEVVSLLGAPAEPARAPWERCGIKLDVQVPQWPDSEDWIDRSGLPDELADLY